MYVAGQRVTCTLDGMAIGCSRAFGMLGFSADIDFARTDPWVLSSLGISWIRREYGDNDAPTPPGGDDSITYATTRHEYEYYFSRLSWGPRGIFPDETPEEAVDNAITEAGKKAAQDKCKTAIEGLLRKAFLEKLKADKVDYNKLSAEERAEIDKYIENELTATKVVDAVKNASKVYAPDDLRLSGSDGHDSATTTHSNGKVTVTFYGGFFNQIMSGKSDIVSQVGPTTPPKPYKGRSTTLSERAYTIIHEGIHAIYPGFTDGFIGRVIKGKNKDLERDQGSKAISDFVKDNCK